MVRRVVRELVVDGRGLHGGERGVVRVRAAAPGSGLLVGRPGSLVPLRPSLAVPDTARCTALRLHGGTVRTVEHLLAALAGSGVCDAAVELEGPEVPILDGSAKPWVEALAAHTAPCADALPCTTAVAAPLRFRRGDASYAVEPAAETTVEVQFAGPRLGVQQVRWNGDAEAFAREFAPARTFALLEEVAGILDAGLAQGGSLDCAVVFGPDGPLGGPLRFPDEPARHKLLDLVGDLALLGRLPAARIVAHAPHHAANVALALELASRSAC
jgi:UDP-3-O-[3-hydroxymyristoyl] N-acetylglucosamine deacetylase